MYPGIELRTMRYIVAVGNELHFSRAAEHVHVVEPSLRSKMVSATNDYHWFCDYQYCACHQEVSSPSNSSTSQRWLVNPASIAGVTRRVL